MPRLVERQRLDAARVKAAKLRPYCSYIGQGQYLVESHSRDEAHVVAVNARAEGQFECDCEGYTYTGMCFHIAAVIAVREFEASQPVLKAMRGEVERPIGPTANLPRPGPKRVLL